LGLPIHGLLTFWTTLDPQPDPSRRYAAWAQFVTTDHHVLTHVAGSGLGTILGIFGVFALAAHMASTRARNIGLLAMVITVLGQTFFLMVIGISAVAAPLEGQAYRAGTEALRDLPSTTASVAHGLIGLLVITLSFLGNSLLGLAIWRSGSLPRWTAVVWAMAALLMYPLGLVVAAAITGSTPRTVLVGALLLTASGGWIAWCVQRGSSPADLTPGLDPSIADLAAGSSRRGTGQ
jgi:hypothetical protein